MQDINLTLSSLDPSALTARLYELRKQERWLLAEFLRYLGEVDRRQVHVAAGFNSLFAYLVEHLGYSTSAAFRRSTAARMVAQYPVIAGFLEDGRLNLTTLVALRDALDQDTHLATLERAAGKTEDQVKELVAALRPRPAPPDLLRRLPTPVAPAAPAAPPIAGPATPPQTRPAGRVEPISEDLRVLRVTVGREFYDDLQAVRAALSHQIPDGNLERVLHECLRRARRELERRREGAAERPRAANEIPARREPTAAVRRQVYRRDGGRCTFVASDGPRCASRHRLELHHIVPFAVGGPTTVSNLTLMCAVHNGHLAELDFGREHMARAVLRDHRREA